MSETPEQQTQTVQPSAPDAPIGTMVPRNAGYYEFGYAIFIVIILSYVMILHRKLIRLEKGRST